MTLRPALIAVALAGVAALSIGLAAGLLQAPASLFGAMTGGISRPSITLPTIVVAGIIDGINPCAFTLLLLFITALLAGYGTSGEQAQARARRRMMVNGGAFIGAIFLAYLLLGTGLMQVSTVLAQNHLGARLGALLSILLGLWMLKDYFLPGVGPRLAAPRAIAARVRGVGGAASALTMFGLGALVSLCTVPCSGAVYIAIISLLALQDNFLVGYSYLLVYNVMFILPLVVILAAAVSRPNLNRMARWNLHHRDKVKLVLGGGVVALGLAILATA
ncbi:MAG: cytochrome c biogenesis CcdA family protein [Paracoccaceae bacterium]